MSGRCGFLVKDDINEAGSISFVTPGKCSSKNEGTFFGSVSSSLNGLDGMKRVHVKEPSYVM